MPELPEVETIRMGFEKYLVGKTIEDVEVRLPKIIQSGNIKNLVGGKIIKIRRFGKVLVLDLDYKLSLVVHIKLTGQFIYQGPDRPKESEISKKYVGNVPNRFTHVIIKLKSQNSKVKSGQTSFLYYNDIRQFGWIRVVPTDEVEKSPFIDKLGPDPIRLSSQVTLTLDNFRQILESKKTAIKVLLMDQKKIGGVGNIYANDALFLAGIDPRRPAGKLLSHEAMKLYWAIIEVLKRGLKYGGATEANYVNILGEPGGYQKHFLVYGKENQPCPNCGGKIIKTRINGRGTYFCPHCQK
ncbi:MAG: bifunctional DNA-formamidopyrimidine glycosylase/DNA-(apurinic or apyrimidinic site) lyase [Candidatus Blackburnbacteria bacterium]|nr:bifunctional DNA-formamidopyrimidine glycosylase/DNA-(apurinic or apyrimidinic site) lyase [Candidatus Blackburnbacteria bacterium]